MNSTKLRDLFLSIERIIVEDASTESLANIRGLFDSEGIEMPTVFEIEEEGRV